MDQLRSALAVRVLVPSVPMVEPEPEPMFEPEPEPMVEPEPEPMFEPEPEPMVEPPEPVVEPPVPVLPEPEPMVELPEPVLPEPEPVLPVVPEGEVPVVCATATKDVPAMTIAANKVFICAEFFIKMVFQMRLKICQINGTNSGMNLYDAI